MSEPGNGTQRLLGEISAGVRALDDRLERHEAIDDTRHRDNRTDYAELLRMVEARLRAIEDKLTEGRGIGKLAKWIGRGVWALGGGAVITAVTKYLPAFLR